MIENIETPVDNEDVPKENLPTTGSSSIVPMGIGMVILGLMIVKYRRKDA